MALQPHADVRMRNTSDTHPLDESAEYIHAVNIVQFSAIFLGMLFLAVSIRAQATQAPAGTAAPAPTHTHRAASRSKKHVQAAPTPAPVAPTPPPPLPPVQQVASPAKINFSHGSLSIEAKNSSLTQILNQISHQTGIKIEGLDRDERIYGQYGPDSVANTLTDLLDGSGYNYVMIGGGEGSAPTKLVLTHSNGGSTASGPGNFPPPGGLPEAQPPDNSTQAQPKTPQQIFDELRKMHPQPQ